MLQNRGGVRSRQGSRELWAVSMTTTRTIKYALQALSLGTAGGGADERRGIEEEIKRPLAYGNRTLASSPYELLTSAKQTSHNILPSPILADKARNAPLNTPRLPLPIHFSPAYSSSRASKQPTSVYLYLPVPFRKAVNGDREPASFLCPVQLHSLITYHFLCVFHCLLM
jgi:hypothetical protein